MQATKSPWESRAAKGEANGDSLGPRTKATPFAPPGQLQKALACLGPEAQAKGRDGSLFTSPRKIKSASSAKWLKIRAVASPLRTLWATPTKRGSPGSSSGGEFCGVFADFPRKEKGMGGGDGEGSTGGGADGGPWL